MGRLLVLFVVLTACASGGSTPTVESPTSTSTTTPAESPVPSEQDIALFVANLTETLASPEVSQAVEGDPLPFVTSGALMCELLADGETPSQVLAGFLESFGPDPAESDRALAGALLGSAVNVFCPQHRQRLIDDLGP